MQKILAQIDWLKVAIAVIVIVVFFYIFTQFKDIFNSSEVKDYDRETNQKNLSLSESEYQTMADALFVATKGDWLSIATNTDEATIFRTLKKLKTKDDWTHLVSIYGTDKQGYTLPAKLNRVLSEKEIAQVNSILSTIGKSI